MLRRTLLLPLIALSAPLRAEAGEVASSAIAVSVEVVSSCTVSASPINLTADHRATAAATSDIAVRCAPNQAFTVALDSGQYASGLVRRAFDAGARRYLAYDIYADSARSRRWGDRGADVVPSSTDSTGLAVLKAYGSLASGQEMWVGQYRDTVVVTVNF